LKTTLKFKRQTTLAANGSNDQRLLHHMHVLHGGFFSGFTFTFASSNSGTPCNFSAETLKFESGV